MAFLSGYNTTLSINSTGVDGSDLTCTLEVDSLDVTNFQSSGYQELVRGIMKMSVSGTIELDGAGLPTVSVGSAVTVASTFSTFGTLSASCLITSATVKGSAKGKITVDFKAESTGTITRPTNLS